MSDKSTQLHLPSTRSHPPPLPLTSLTCLIQSHMIASTTTTIPQRQEEWAAKLRTTLSDLERTTETALRSHNAYMVAMDRLAQLHTYGAALMERVAAQHLAEDNAPLAEVSAAKSATASLHTAFAAWRRSADELASIFLQRQKNVWHELEAEAFCLTLSHREHRQVTEHAKKLMKKRKAVERLSGNAASGHAEEEVTAALRRQAEWNSSISKDTYSVARKMCRELTRSGTKQIDVLSATAHVCAQSFQPIGAVPVGGAGQYPHTVNGIVLQRPPLAASANGSDGESDPYGPVSANISTTGSTTFPHVLASTLRRARSEGRTLVLAA